MANCEKVWLKPSYLVIIFAAELSRMQLIKDEIKCDLQYPCRRILLVALSFLIILLNFGITTSAYAATYTKPKLSLFRFKNHKIIEAKVKQIQMRSFITDVNRHNRLTTNFYEKYTGLNLYLLNTKQSTVNFFIAPKSVGIRFIFAK
jgi:hypothetical protein